MKLYLVRSDQGDGGWSIHAREQEDEDGIAPALVSGPAKLVGEEWDRPNADDWAMAHKAISSN